MAFDFSGTGQYISRASTPITAVPITLACWANIDNTTANHTLLGVNDGTINNAFYIRANGAVAGDPIGMHTIAGGAGNAAASTVAYTASTWLHACGVSSAVNSRAAYLNGGSKGTQTTSRTPSGLNRTEIGAIGGTVLTDGRIAEAAIWSAALNDQEVASLAKGMCPLLVRPTKLVMYWPGQNSLLHDWLGGAFTATGSPTAAAHPNQIIYPRRRGLILPAPVGQPTMRRYGIARPAAAISRNPYVKVA